MISTKKSLLTSAVALMVLISMFVGSTFAWFTDTVSSAGNIIQSGSLDAKMYWAESYDSTDWNNAADTKIFDYDKWEPGYTEVRYVRIENKGTLNFKWRLTIDAEGKVTALSDVIDVYYVNPVTKQLSKEEILDTPPAGSLTDVLANKSANNGSLKPNEFVILAIAFHMDELAGNEYQDMSLCDGGFALNLIATQDVGESDSFDDQYDVNAEWPYLNIKYSVGSELDESVISTDASGSPVLNTETAIGEETDDIFATIPAGVTLADGADKLTLTVTSMEKPNADVSTTTRDEILRSVDIHVDGISENNTVPMTFVLKELFPAGLNDNNVKLYHVEGDETKEMTLVSNPVNHNEFSYDPLTGDAVITIASFSEVATYADTDAAWDGETVTAYTEEGDTIKIANAQQFAYFRNQVDAGNDFAGKTILLTADINLNDYNFDPIGWGYDNTAWNRDGAEGKVFKGTFDGAGYTIYGLYQSGWGLEASTGTDYTYTNCGGGLFASALDATFKNLTIDGARITFECVEIGVLVGLAQGSCTFENITIAGCKIANYQRPAGGVVGEVSPKVENGSAVESTHTFNNVYVDSNTVVGSLWGDFDTPVGGVIGTYWDDAGKTYISMTDVTVACELDVYNDVTSTYQWYAYRRAGMLIGNTYCSEKNESGTNIASTNINGTEHLTCSNVIVFYGDWANYHYCEFHDSNPKWPWVRVEPGENCSGYSNPRWGLATDPVTGEKVTDSVHNHGDGESHLTSIPFHQLYGGGQGVYGEETHDGVSEGIYTVTYMDHGEVLHVDYVIDNKVAYTAPAITDIIPSAADGTIPSYWVDGNGNKFTGFDAGRTANATVYPKWPNEYTIRCLDTYGNVAYYAFVTDDTTTDAEYEEITTNINNTLASIQNEVDAGKKVMIIKWQDANGNLYETITVDMLGGLSDDLILTATPELLNGSISLTPIYNDTTGELIAYHVTDVVADDSNTNIVIPDYVGTVPVTKIAEGAFDDFDNLHVIKIPNTVTTLDKSMFPGNNNIWGSGRQTVTIYYEGTAEQWENLNKVDEFVYSTGLFGGSYVSANNSWDNSLGEGTRVFFLGANGKVDLSQGYYEVTDTPTLGSVTDTEWSENKQITQSIKDICTGTCDCDVTGCSGNTRPDAIYWEGVTIE